MTAPITGVVLTEECRDLRRPVGPMAWTVPEDLALDAMPDDAGVMVARTSARRVAEHLDIQPGTGARALARLRNEGLVSLAREVGPAGRFGLSVHRLAAIPVLTFTGLLPCVDAPVVAAPNTGGPGAATPGWGWVRSDVVGAGCAADDAAVALEPVGGTAMPEGGGMAPTVPPLLEAERIAPEVVRLNITARELLRECLRREKRSAIPGLRGLAQRAGIAS